MVQDAERKYVRVGNMINYRAELTKITVANCDGGNNTTDIHSNSSLQDRNMISEDHYPATEPLQTGEFLDYGLSKDDAEQL